MPEPETGVEPQTREVILGDFMFQALRQGDDILSGSVASSTVTGEPTCEGTGSQSLSAVLELFFS